MASLKALVLLSFLASIGLMFLILSCALPAFNNNWWPFFVIIFYVLAPIPNLLARRCYDGGSSHPCKEFAYFMTAGIVVSAFSLPIILARSPPADPVIQWSACGLVIASNIVAFLTIFGFFIMADNDSVEYSMW